MSLVKALVVAAALALPLQAHAVVVDWTDWTTYSGGVVDGTLVTGSTSIGVSYTGGVSGVQLSGGTNYWTEYSPAPYTSGTVSNAPPTTDIVQLASGGTGTITFTQAVLNPIIALVSWNNNTVDFGTQIEIVSYGQGYWGSGTPILNSGGTGFYGSGEVHGLIRVLGNFTTVSFAHTAENWHGLTVGVEGVATPEVPVPAGLPFLAAGIGALALFSRRRKS